MQPAQLSLLPDTTPAPPTEVLAEVPEPEVRTAIAELARLILNATATATPAASGEASDD